MSLKKIRSRLESYGKKDSIKDRLANRTIPRDKNGWRLDGVMDPEGKYPNPFNGQEYSQTYFDKGINNPDKPWNTLPVYNDRYEFLEMIKKNQIVILISDPGSGKTVIVPKLLSHYFDYQKKIIVTTPRQKTTAGAAGWSSILMDVKLGKEIGLRHGNEKKKDGRLTKILYTTDGSLVARMSHNDTELREYNGLIIDEAHERSVNIDLLLLLAKMLVKRRPDFKLIIMSATIDPKIFKEYYTIPGSSVDVYVPKVKKSPYKVALKYLKKKIKPDNAIDEITKMVDKILIGTQTGGVLVFVTSVAETFKICNYIRRKIEDKPNYYPVKPYCIALSGETDEGTKDYNIIEGKDPPPQGYGRRIIISTNVAESSITFKNLVYVIDSGLRFEKYYDPKKYAYIGGKVYVARANIDQRCGRTGRTNPGVCLKMYTQSQFEKFPNYPDPEIEKADITETLLRILNLSFIGGNLNNAYYLLNELITRPKDIYISRGVFNLYYLGLLGSDGNITKLGWIANKFGKFSPQIARMLIAAYHLDCLAEAIIMAAILFETDALDSWFIKPPNMANKPAIKREYISNIKKFAHPSGDHMTLFNVYLRYLSRGSGNTWINKNQREWLHKHNLSVKMIQAVNLSVKELKDSVRQNIKLIKELDMFEIINEPTKSKVRRTNLKKPYTRQYGGYENLIQNKSNSDISNLRNALFQLNSNNNKTSIENIKISSFFDTPNVYNNKKYNSQNGTDRYQSGSGKDKPKNIKRSRKRLKDGKKQKKSNKNRNQKKALNITNAKLIKYLDSITLHDFKRVRLNKFAQKSDNILSALFFGFYMNFATRFSPNDPQSKKYMIKIANNKGSISGSVIDLLGKSLPKNIIYNEYYIILGKDKLNLITQIAPKIIINYIKNNKSVIN